MTPRWHHTRWFWLGLLGLVLWVGAWVGSFAGGKGHVWSWSDSRRHYYFSHGGGRIGGGIGESVTVRYPALKSMNGSRHSTWDLKREKAVSWFPMVRFKIEDGNANLWSHYSIWIAGWSLAWLLPLVCRSLPRCARSPRFPGSPRRSFTSPFLWAGLPGFVLVVMLWIDSSTYRSSVNWKWTRGFKIEPHYLGFGVESNRGQATIWAGRAYEGMYFRNTKPGLFGERKQSTGAFFQPDSKSRKGARRFQTSYLALTGIYFLLWACAAASWQYRQSRLRRPQVAAA